jgi:hypothetical protein
MPLQRGHISAAKVEVTEIRSLERGDLTLLLEKRPAVVLKSLRDSHHQVARAVAAGMGNQEVAEVCGRSINRVAMLKKDPAFADLVAHYRGVVTAEFIREADPVLDYLRNNALKAQRMISDQLDEAEEEGKAIPMRNLLTIAELGLDRTGYGKMQKNLNVNVDFAAQLEAARRRSGEARTREHGALREVGTSVHPHASRPSIEIEAQPTPPLVPQSVPQPPIAPIEPLAEGPFTFRRRIGGP